jgi:hypothetical protein
MLLVIAQPTAEATDLNLTIYPAELEPTEAVWVDLRMSDCQNTTMKLTIDTPSGVEVWKVQNLSMPEDCRWRTSVIIEYAWGYGTYAVVVQATTLETVGNNTTARNSQRVKTFDAVFGPKVAEYIFRNEIEGDVAPLVEANMMLANQQWMGLGAQAILGTLVIALLAHIVAKRERRRSWWHKSFGRVSIKPDRLDRVLGKHSFAPKLRNQNRLTRYARQIQEVDKRILDLDVRKWDLEKTRAVIQGELLAVKELLDGKTQREAYRTYEQYVNDLIKKEAGS